MKPWQRRLRSSPLYSCSLVTMAWMMLAIMVVQHLEKLLQHWFLSRQSWKRYTRGLNLLRHSGRISDTIHSWSNLISLRRWVPYLDFPCLATILVLWLLISYLSGTKVGSITVIPRDHTNTSTGNDKVQILLRNARQILNVVIATFPSFENDGPSHSCHEIPSNVERLACEWKAIMQQLQGLAEQDDAEAWQATISQVST